MENADTLPLYGQIGFDDFNLIAIIGDLPRERVEPQLLVVDLRVDVDFSKVAHSDLLADTIDYVGLAELCKEEAAFGYRLIETLAASILAKVMARLPVREGWIRVKKPLAIQGASCAVVELRRLAGK